MIKGRSVLKIIEETVQQSQLYMVDKCCTKIYVKALWAATATTRKACAWESLSCMLTKTVFI